MRFFGKKRHTPTDEQRKRLAGITNVSQRRTLLAAIERGETIPDYAWTPFPEGLEQDPRLSQLHELLVQSAASSGRDMMEVIASLRPDSEIQYFADKARESSSEQTGCLCAVPLRAPELVLEANQAAGILAWGIFNPYGPSLNFLALIRVPEHLEYLLYSTQMNPFHCQNLVYGVVPVSIADYLTDILNELFSKYATGEFGLFSDSLPSFILPLSDQVNLADLVYRGLAHIGSQTVKLECQLLRRIPNDPWQMATEMQRMAFQEIQDKVPPPPIPQPATTDELDEWLSLVIEKEHWLPYIGQMRHAWAGAIIHGPNQLAAMEWEAAERVLWKLWPGNAKD